MGWSDPYSPTEGGGIGIRAQLRDAVDATATFEKSKSRDPLRVPSALDRADEFGVTHTVDMLEFLDELEKAGVIGAMGGLKGTGAGSI